MDACVAQSGRLELLRSNLWIYNLYLVPQYLFYLYFYGQVLASNHAKKIIAITGVIYCAFGITNLLFIQKLHNASSYTLIFGNILLILLTISYFNQLLKENEIVKLGKESLVYISVGALIFHLGSLPFFINLNFLNRVSHSLTLSLHSILLFMNIFMYSFYSIAFLCKPHSRRQAS